jgi:hypothetical protein
MASENILKPLRESLEKAAILLDKELNSRSSWGELNFSDAADDVGRTKHIISNLKLMPLEALTDTNVSQLTSAIDGATVHLTKVDQFKIVDNAVSQRASLVQQIHAATDNLTSIAGPLIPFLAYQRGDVAANIQKLSSSVIQAQEIIGSAKKSAELELVEIKKVSAEARAAAAKAGAAHFTTDFEEEVKTNRKSAGRWLIATGVFAGLTILIALFSLMVALNNPNLTTSQLLQILVAKVIVLSVLFTATIWCGRLYKASLHQAATNRHRALSLMTFTAFSAAASDEQTRNAVLLETTRAIFGSSSTGYLDDKGTDESGLKIIEIIKAIGPKLT